MAKTYRLGSSEMVNAHGIVRWAINGYAFKRERRKLEDVLLAWPGIPRSAIKKLLSQEVPYTVLQSEKNSPVVEFTV